MIKLLPQIRKETAACHTSGGVAPELGSSEWAAGSHEVFIRILLHGKRGGRGVMTPFSWMDDEEIAAIVSYVRKELHEKEEITVSEVERIRNDTRTRTELWTDEELRDLLK